MKKVFPIIILVMLSLAAVIPYTYSANAIVGEKKITIEINGEIDAPLYEELEKSVIKNSDKIKGGDLLIYDIVNYGDWIMGNIIIKDYPNLLGQKIIDGGPLDSQSAFIAERDGIKWNVALEK